MSSQTNNSTYFQSMNGLTTINADDISVENLELSGKLTLLNNMVVNNLEITPIELSYLKNGVGNIQALKADITSPNLLGIPTAPTAAVATNTNQISSCKFVLDNINYYITSIFNSINTWTNLNTFTSRLTATGLVFLSGTSTTISNLSIGNNEGSIIKLNNGGIITIIDDAISSTLIDSVHNQNINGIKTFLQPIVSSGTAITGLTKTQVGLASVDNTSDLLKPISTATQNALNLKANQTSISNIDNTSDLNKPISTATQSALNLKANIISPSFSGIPLSTTALVGNRSSQIATCAFVMENITSNGGNNSSILATNNIWSGTNQFNNLINCGDVAGAGINKILLHSSGSGIGMQTDNTVKYISNNGHNFFTGGSLISNGSLTMQIDNVGNVNMIGNLNVGGTITGNISSLIQPLLDLKANQTSISNIDNTSDLLKPISTATQSALALKANQTSISNIDNTSDLLKPISTATQLLLDLKANQTSISNIDNTSDVNKPISTATQLLLDLKANQTSISNIDNTSDLLKPVSTATQSALDLKANSNSPSFTGTPTCITQSVGNNTTALATTAFVMANQSGGSGASNLATNNIWTGTNQFNSTITANGGIEISSGGTGLCSISQGNGDGATFDKYNLAIKSWWGIGFMDYTNIVRIVFDTRRGEIKASYLNASQSITAGGLITANGGIINTSGVITLNNSMVGQNANQIQFIAGTKVYTIQQIDNAGQDYLRLGRNGYGDIIINNTGDVNIGSSLSSYGSITGLKINTNKIELTNSFDEFGINKILLHPAGYGFGVGDSAQLKYLSGYKHIFYSGSTTTSNGTEIMRIDEYGNLNVKGNLNVSGTITGLDLKANLISPSFTGTPLSITAPVGTNSTQIATTAFVLANQSNNTALLSSNNTFTGTNNFTNGFSLNNNIFQYTPWTIYSNNTNELANIVVGNPTGNPTLGVLKYSYSVLGKSLSLNFNYYQPNNTGCSAGTGNYFYTFPAIFRPNDSIIKTSNGTPNYATGSILGQYTINAFGSYTSRGSCYMFKSGTSYYIFLMAETGTLALQSATYMHYNTTFPFNVSFNCIIPII